MSRLPPRVAPFAAALSVAFAVAAGCGPAAPSAERAADPAGGPLKVVATTGMVADLVRHVAGDTAGKELEIQTLFGPGVDPHLYKPTGADVRAIRGADVVFYSGLNLEEGLSRLLARRAESGEPVYAVTAGLPEDELLSPPEFAGHPDPHVWHDVALWSRCLEVVADALAGARPENADAFRANAAAYREELLALDGAVRRAIATIPERRRVLVTAHDAFGYFSRTYAIPVKSVQGVTTQSEAGVADVNNLAKFLADNGVPAIFAETSVSDRAVRAVVEGANRRGGDVKISGDRLYSDALGDPAGGAEDYAGTITANVRAIVAALGGTLPDGGLVRSPPE